MNLEVFRLGDDNISPFKIYRHTWGMRFSHSITMELMVDHIPCCGERNFIQYGCLHNPTYTFDMQYLICLSCGRHVILDVSGNGPYPIYPFVFEDGEFEEWGWSDEVSDVFLPD